MHGFVVIDKPEGLTSHDVVAAIRRICQTKKVGHTGTLDPFATGVLPVAIGEGTKVIPFLDESVKVYQAVLRLGTSTDTQDRTGTVLRQGEWQHLTPADIRAAIPHFTGPIAQIPPMYSALKRDGVPLYRLARAGKEVVREPRQITIHALTIDQYSLPDVTFTVSCSPGTYVRTLAADIGEMLGCGAHLVSLRRLQSGPFSLAGSFTLATLQEAVTRSDTSSWLLTPREALATMSEVRLTDSGRLRVERGISPTAADCLASFSSATPGQKMRLTWQDQLQAVAEYCGESDCNNGKRLRLLRVFNMLYPLHDATVMLKNQD
jgi:tRNA pseudouridine55 synthase